MRQSSEQRLEQMIAEALRRELDDANFPPPEQQMWMRISSRLNQTSRPKRVSLFYRKVAVSVAAMLVLAAGIAGLYRLSWGFRTWNVADKGMEDLAGHSADCSITAVRNREEEDTGCSSEQDPVDTAPGCETCQEFAGFVRSEKNIDNTETGRFEGPPAALDGHYLLEKEVVPVGEADGWRGGIYGGPGGKLLWICKMPPAESPEQLLAGVGSVFKIRLHLQTPAVDGSGLIVEDSTGNPGVVIRDGRCDRLLLVDEGCFTEWDLWDIVE